jgi:hypothetical protein
MNRFSQIVAVEHPYRIPCDWRMGKIVCLRSAV